MKKISFVSLFISFLLMNDTLNAMNAMPDLLKQRQWHKLIKRYELIHAHTEQNRRLSIANAWFTTKEICEMKQSLFISSIKLEKFIRDREAWENTYQAGLCFEEHMRKKQLAQNENEQLPVQNNHYVQNPSTQFTPQELQQFKEELQISDAWFNEVVTCHRLGFTQKAKQRSQETKV